MILGLPLPAGGLRGVQQFLGELRLLPVHGQELAGGLEIRAGQTGSTASGKRRRPGTRPTRRRATNALQRLARRGDAVTFRRLAETAGVSRSWLYRQPQLRDEIIRLRDASAGRPGNLPSAERATTHSLRQQLLTYRDEISRLRTENQELRDQLARHLGAARVAAVTRGTKQS